MNNTFHKLAKGLTQTVSRRAALKTFGIGLGVISFTLITFTPVFGAGRNSLNYTTRLLPVGDELRASGLVKMTVIHGTVSGTYIATVSCKGLTPVASYELRGSNGARDFDFGIRAADKQGTVQFGFSGVYGDNLYTSRPRMFEIYRIEPTGNVLVLSGGFWQQERHHGDGAFRLHAVWFSSRLW
jgi:hypothetical protein